MPVTVASVNAEDLPLIADYREKTTASGTAVFGAPLSSAKKSGRIPAVVEECVRFLEQKGLNEEGLLRLAGSSSEAKMIKETFDRGGVPDFSKINDLNSVSDVLKLYLRSLPMRPLLQTKGIKEASRESQPWSLTPHQRRTIRPRLFR